MLFRSRNEGVAASGEIDVGAECAGEFAGRCSASARVESIPVGESASATLTLTMPPGEGISAYIFAGALESGFRWGASNALETTVEVPEKPDTDLAMDAQAEVAGWWSNGDANVRVTVDLHNRLPLRHESVHRISLTCVRGVKPLDGCGTDFSVALPAGKGPGVEIVTMRAPMGGVTFEFAYGEGKTFTREFDVPQRIIGVDRDVWECFSDRPGLRIERGSGDYIGGCASWGRETIGKWDQSRPVRVWATGREDYIAIVEDVLEELSPLLNLEFEWSESERRADLKVYAGLPASSAASVGFADYCAEAAGCAGWDYHNDRGRRNVVQSGYFSVWLNEHAPLEYIKEVAIHEAIHALVTMLHRTELVSIMESYGGLGKLSRMDEALIRLHQHRLVEPGISMAEIERLIVFSEDVIDYQPKELDGYELALSALATLHEAGSARFELRGGWSCAGFGGWADYSIGDFVRFIERLSHFDDGSHQKFEIIGRERWEVWKQIAGQWREGEREGWPPDFDRAPPHLAHSYSSPLTMLENVLLTDADDIIVARDVPGRVRLTVSVDNRRVWLYDDEHANLYISILLDDETYQILEYTFRWDFSTTSCDYETEAFDGEYGIEIDIPDAVREGSLNLP